VSEALRLALLLTAYVLVRAVMAGATRFDEGDYRHSVLIGRFAQSGVFALAGLYVTGQLWLRVRNPERYRFVVDWTAWGLPKLRWIVAAIAIPLLWQIVTTDYNYYFGEAYVIDRCLLVCLTVVALVYPVALLPLVVYAIAFASQYRHPGFDFSWTDKSLPIALAAVLVAFHGIQVWKPQAPRLLLAGLLTITAAHYFVPGLAKLTLDADPTRWMLENRIDNLFATSHVMGWLGDHRWSELSGVADVLRGASVPMQVATIVIEVGAIAMCVHRRAPSLVLAGGFLLHAGIFAGSGVCFWKWMIVDVVLFCLLSLSWRKSLAELVRARAMAIMVTLAILASPLYSGAIALGWFDSGYVTAYSVEVIDRDGRAHRLASTAFGGYDLVFAQGRFHRLSQSRLFPVDTYGCTLDGKLARTIERSILDDTVMTALAAHGVERYDAYYAGRFARFLESYFAGVNTGLRVVVPDWLEAPTHLWQSTGRELDEIPLPILRARVRERSFAYGDDALIELGDSIVLDVVIESN
jgi:hypothetical protein